VLCSRMISSRVFMIARHSWVIPQVCQCQAVIPPALAHVVSDWLHLVVFIARDMFAQVQDDLASPTAARLLY
jgi:hypothetical protein